jgi:2-succinyl-5-enolpyruvyl-6-hydroxy-3-cyclohexene-1-carboxylate synthase
VPIVDASWPSGLSVARTTMAALPTGAAIQLGSSNPVRDVDLAADPRPDVRVVANRGLAGIDGTVSSAVGLALIHEGPTYALVGDLTFLHDLTGMIIGPQEPAPDLMIVVVNDDGGGIFSTLEQGAPEYAERFERLFGTPTGADLAGLCAGVGVSHQLASTREELAEAVVAAPRGLSVVEVRCRRDSLRGLHGAIRAPLRGQ